ncbi:MAG: PTS sugar transporter subunit IIA [Candidatus Tritonobacter lacicola]|nr:PTS sugar transporter subunit IIA [Candidatus Tritonobacter lacicola]
MFLHELIPVEAISTPLKGKNKQEVIEEMVELLCKTGRVTDKDSVLKSILEREKTMSTGVGEGVAIPHGKSDGVTELAGALGICPEGVDFDSIDKKPAYIIFAMEATKDNPGPHIRALSKISRLLKNEEFRNTIINAGSPEKIYEAIKTKELA